MTCLHFLCVSGDFSLVYWVKEGSISVLKSEKLIGDTSVSSESQVKLGHTFHPVKIAAIGMCAYAKYVKCVCCTCTCM